MPGLYKDEGVVLRTIKLGEADRIVTIFTRENGKVRAVAKGIRKTKSRFGGRLEPFTRARLMFYRGRDLDIVTSVDVLESHSALRVDYDRLTAAAALVEAVEKITPDREKAFSTYALLLSGLGALVEKGPSAIVPAFLLKLMSVSGYHPQLTACAQCGEGRGLYGFSSSLGGVICGRCRVEDRTAVRISQDRIALLSRLLASDFGQQADPAALAEITHTLRRYAEYHLERPLRSAGLAPAL